MKIALIGCGNWGRHILRDLKSLDCHVTVIDFSEQGQANAANGKADHILPSISDLKAASLDGAVIATNSISHYDIICELLSYHAQLPIYIEKPMCIEPAHADDLCDRAPDNLFVMHKWRYHNGILKLAELCQSGKWGAIQGIKMIRKQWGQPHRDVDAIWILLPHDLTIAYEILGYIPEPVFARYDQGLSNQRILGMSGWLESAQHWVSFDIGERHPSHARESAVYMEKGIAFLAGADESHIEVFTSDDASLNAKPEGEKFSFENEYPLYRELQEFLDYIEGNASPPKSTVRDGRLIVQTIHKLRQLAISH